MAVTGWVLSNEISSGDAKETFLGLARPGVPGSLSTERTDRARCFVGESTAEVSGEDVRRLDVVEEEVE
jgi:hypothetical protein